MSFLPPQYPASTIPLTGVAHTPEVHLRLGLFVVVATIIEAAAAADAHATFSAFPFLAEYRAEIAALLGSGPPTAARLRAALPSWEVAGNETIHLPLRALAASGIGPAARELLLAAGLVEEDPRFGDVFDQATGGIRRPTIGLLLGWWRGPPDSGRDVADLRAALHQLHHAGLIHSGGVGIPQSEWPVTVPVAIWEALQGQSTQLEGVRHLPRSALMPIADFVAPESVTQLYRQLPVLLMRDPDCLLLVRGATGNGRRTLIGSVAHALRRDVLIGDAAVVRDPARWRTFGAVAVLTRALPAIEVPLSPGENHVLPALPFAGLPLAVATGGRGGIATEDDRAIVTVERPMPDTASRRALWQRALPDQSTLALDGLASAMRLGSGMIARCARAVSTRAALEGRYTITPEDVRAAARTLGATRLDAAASRIETQGSLSDLALDDITRDELALLATRCRHRETLAQGPFDADAASGVRALLAGPSGTGKTLAARLLAATLGKDLYRIDLAATVSKYIGETEKNLDSAFAAAEALDIVLLLDEGDSLMTARTHVGSSNDRYANLETNFLLQRVEQFSGILLITTNAADRIDGAFARRMDVVIHFRAPDEQRRHEILRLHLGGDANSLSEALLQEIAWRCALTGGQLRNVVQHARLLALAGGCAVADEHLRAAVRREYRRTGAPIPLKSSAGGR